MAGRFHSTLLLLLLIATVPPIYGTLFTSNDHIYLIDRILQLVWEPSSLIRLWVGLDQLYNIGRSWGGVARKLASLPFGGDHQDHISIQEPRSSKYPQHKPSASSQWERFNHIYSSSSISPIVAPARSRLLRNEQSIDNALSSSMQSVKADPNSDVSGLPPLFLFQPQEVFLNSEMMGLFQNTNGLGHSAPFRNRVAADHGLAASRLMDLQHQESTNRFLKQKYTNPMSAVQGPVHPKIVKNNAMLKMGPQERLNSFLILMKTLGAMHTKKIRAMHAGKFASAQANYIAPMG